LVAGLSYWLGLCSSKLNGGLLLARLFLAGMTGDLANKVVEIFLYKIVSKLMAKSKNKNNNAILPPNRLFILINIGG